MSDFACCYSSLENLVKFSTSSPSEKGQKTINLAICFKRGNVVNITASVSQVGDSTKLNFCRWKCWVEFSFGFEQRGEVRHDGLSEDLVGFK